MTNFPQLYLASNQTRLRPNFSAKAWTIWGSIPPWSYQSIGSDGDDGFDDDADDDISDGHGNDDYHDNDHSPVQPSRAPKSYEGNQMADGSNGEVCLLKICNQ